MSDYWAAHVFLVVACVLILATGYGISLILPLLR